MTKQPFQFQTNTITIDKSFHQVLPETFMNSGGDINFPKMFTLVFTTIPNILIEQNIDVVKALEWFTGNYEYEIQDVYYNKKNTRDDNISEYDDVMFFLFKDTMLHFDANRGEVKILYRTTEFELVESIAAEIRKFKEKDKSSKIHLLINSSHGVTLEAVKLADSDIDITLNYNDDFQPIDEIISKRLSEPNEKGIILLHGEPGTGKTSYIRHLISQTKKTIIFVPHTMAHALTSPDFISLLLDNRNSILVIEDAENIIVDRNRDGQSPVSAILNLSDGLLSDCLNLQIICTFNSDFTKIDSALTRKGRLIARYEFNKLLPSKANRLAEKLGVDICYQKPVSLTDIYNTDEIDFNKNREVRQIGFMASAYEENMKI